jgi:aminopeptidase N
MTLATKPHQPVLLKHYRAPAWQIPRIDLNISLEENASRVSTTMQVIRAEPGVPDLVLDGEGLRLLSVSVDDKVLGPGGYTVLPGGLRIHNAPETFELKLETEVNPSTNKELSGLYLSSGVFCTQCEAEGFRRITYFLDRPDVLSVYTTTLVADLQACPVLLSNGNPVASGKLPDGRHWARWEDPHPKPSYLFALVAGDLVSLDDTFTTCSGQEVALRIYVEAHYLDQCDHAMASLKQAMAWDERRYGREYDLTVYNIVAVDDFNMGAMENKGLNIFNTKYVLAKPETATDTDYDQITGVVGHEYFHNWSGNRVTCRDWFQLSLKEGFTVFRDQQFSAETTSGGVKRISDADLVRTHQFREDSGPMAHPVRPESYVEINNFYTLTVYIKGAEVVRMLANLLGEENFRRGCDLYFDKFDGRAATTDDFLWAMETATQVDLSQFRRWYAQAGTPALDVRTRYDHALQTYDIEIRQDTPETPGQSAKAPFQIPIKAALFNSTGQPLEASLGNEHAPAHSAHLLNLTKSSQTFRFHGVSERPVPSLLREFSAPVRLESDLSDEDLCVLMGHDTDPFNRWDAGQRLATREVFRSIEIAPTKSRYDLSEPYRVAYFNLLTSPFEDRTFQALVLKLPGEAFLSESMPIIAPTAVHEARREVIKRLAARFKDPFVELYHRLAPEGAYTYDPPSVGRRALRNTALSFLMCLEDPGMEALCKRQLSEADNMTDRFAALKELADSAGASAQEAVMDFYQKWKDYPLVVDKWLRVQATSRLPDTLARVIDLTRHAAYQADNPNKIHALVGAFCHDNPYHFHATDGAGYRFLAEQVTITDRFNPQVAARLVSAFNQWRRYDESRQRLMRSQLEEIGRQPRLSKDVGEIVSRALA